MIVGIIPARGGSKRIQGKNTREFCGKPIIAYSIDAARSSGLFDEIIVSTDDENIAMVSERCGAKVPFRRPANLSDDFTPTIPVIRHAVGWIQENLGPVSLACCLYATAPFISANDLKQGFSLFGEHGGDHLDFAFSITTFPYSIFRALKFNEGTVEMFFPEKELTRSQDLPEAWHDAGQFYWGTTDAWLTCDRIFSARSAGVPVPRERVQDIDTEEDWVSAERKFQAGCAGHNRNGNKSPQG